MTNRNPYEIMLKKFADRRAHVLIYDATRGDRDETWPSFVGIWRGNNPRRDLESIGPLIRQGLAGFNLSATWKDLTDQLESSGFQRVDVVSTDILRAAADVVRIIFWTDGMISCQWLTLGPDDSARAANLPIAVLPPREGN